MLKPRRVDADAFHMIRRKMTRGCDPIRKVARIQRSAEPAARAPTFVATIGSHVSPQAALQRCRTATRLSRCHLRRACRHCHPDLDDPSAASRLSAAWADAHSGASKARAERPSRSLMPMTVETARLFVVDANSPGTCFGGGQPRRVMPTSFSTLPFASGHDHRGRARWRRSVCRQGARKRLNRCEMGWTSGVRSHEAVPPPPLARRGLAAVLSKSWADDTASGHAFSA
jgi:hypothetical protein